MDNLSTAAKATLDALAELGHGDINEIREKAGKARATTDKALKELAGAGLIVEVDTGADPADGTPPRWQLATLTVNTTAGDIGPLTEADTAAPTEADPAAADSGTGEAAARPTRPADRKVLIVAGVLGDYPDGTTIDVIAEACGLGIATVARLLSAMAQADAARRIPADPDRGTAELWKPGAGKASQVDPNPAPERCPTCRQVLRQARPAPTGTSTIYDGTRQINSDGSEPFKRGELEQLVEDFINEHPGHTLTPQDIATELTARHGREISSGAVRNNCTKLAAAGKAQLASETPLAFTANPTPPADANRTQ